MGSKSDSGHVSNITKWLSAFGIAHDVRIASAHKTPAALLRILDEYERRDGPLVYITVAGLSDALSGMVDFATRHPVVACPPPSDSFGGADIFSSLRMPPGVAAATVLDPKSAAVFAAKILGEGDPSLAARVGAFHAEAREKIGKDDGEMRRVDCREAEGGTAAQRSGLPGEDTTK